MGAELRIRVTEDRVPPEIGDLDGLAVDDEEWRLSLEAHRDLLVELTGVEPDGDLTLQELVTIRARLEGYVERTSRSAERAIAEATDSDTDQVETRARNRNRDRSLWGVGRFLEWLRTVVGSVGGARPDETTASDDEASQYPEETVRALAAVFRAAADAERRERTEPTAAPTGRTAAD